MMLLKYMYTPCAFEDVLPFMASVIINTTGECFKTGLKPKVDHTWELPWVVKLGWFCSVYSVIATTIRI